MIGLLFNFLPFGKLITLAIDIAYNLAIKLLGLIFYLASEYWGRWVLAGLVISLALLYGRYHYLHEGRETEARFREVLIDKALEDKCPEWRGSPAKSDNWGLENWPGG